MELWRTRTYSYRSRLSFSSSSVNKAEQANTSKVGGAAELASAIMGPYAMIVIAIVIAMVIFIPLIIFAFKSGGSSTPSVEATVSQFLKKASKRRNF